MADRERAGLLLFGVLEILAGVFLGISALALAALSWGAGSALGIGAIADPSTLAGGNLGTAALLYAGLSALFVSLGVGSVLPRRWVRPLVLYVAKLWIVAGVLILVVMAGYVATGGLSGAIGETDESRLGALAVPAIVVLLGGVLAVLYVVFPAALLWFHRRRALKEALERLDPAPRWTDHCPQSVLSLSLSLALSALLCLPFARGPVPLFGWTLTGALAACVTLVTAAVLAVLAVATYRLSPAGWWGSIAAVVALTIVSVDMSFRFDLSQLAAGFSMVTPPDPGAAAATGAVTAAAASSSGWLLGAGSLLFGFVCLVALLRLRRYFVSPA